jgi:hypothetical protein
MTENSKIDWTRAVDPRDVMWISYYCPAWDAMIAVPVLRASPAASKAIKRGIIKEISRDEAQTLNEPFAEEEWFKEKIEARWEEIEQLGGPLPRIATTLRIRLPADYVATDGPGLPRNENLLLNQVSMRRLTEYSPGMAAKIVDEAMVAAESSATDASSPEAERDRLWNLLVQSCK